MAGCYQHNVTSIITDAISRELRNFFSAYVKQFDDETLQLEKKYIKTIRPYFDQQEEAVLKALRKKSKSVNDAENVLDAGFWDDLLRKTLGDIYYDIILAGGTAAAAAIGASFSVQNPDVVKLLHNKLDKIVDINITTQEAVNIALQKGIAAGDSIDLMAIRVQQVFADASAYRATMIARTEVVGGYNGSAREAYIQGDVTKNQWLSTLDERTRDGAKGPYDHASAHMQIGTIKKGFIVSGERLLYPGDPNGSAGNIINCRCTTIAIIE